MDDKNARPERPAENLISRPPTQADLIKLCRELNQRGAKYVVVGGWAIIAAGLPRATADVDLIVAADPENEAKVFDALSTLPDNAVRELKPGELQQYTVIRVGDARPAALIMTRRPSTSSRGSWRGFQFRLPPHDCSGG
jgi:hypothetical protein